ncbi:hypothetical protein [Bacteroides acidifaciens]|uniref:hypothetical protein n=1 Tax=Bacteroides acidifaciens TaxID=85831 RepID=UPI00242BE82D|nr:hypothetical protein [Bacteroides acidifaciens]
MTHNTDKDGKAVFRPLPEKSRGFSDIITLPQKSVSCFHLPEEGGDKSGSPHSSA